MKMKANKDDTNIQKVIKIFEIELLPNLSQKLFIWSITLSQKKTSHSYETFFN